MQKELIMFTDPRSPISEVFRTLRTNIQFMSKNKSSQTMLISSTNAGEGKSWVSANLAIAMAQTGKKVILIDADMRKGRQHKIFGLLQKPGLSNYLSSAGDQRERIGNTIAEYIQETEIENLHVISSGNVPPNPSELLILPEMIELLDNLKKVYDLIIIDGTPCQLVTDSLIIARIVDYVVLVAACKETKKKDLKRVVENIRNVGGDIFGFVLNKVPISSKKYEKSYYYGSHK